MIDSLRPAKIRRLDKGEATREKLETQLQAMEDKVQEMRRNLSSSEQLPCPLDIAKKFDAVRRTFDLVREATREVVKITCARAFEEGSAPMLWRMCMRSYKEDLDPAFVRVALESGSVFHDAVSWIPSEIFDENYDYWMKVVPDSPILLIYLPTTQTFSDFDDEVIWRYPSIRKSRYYWLRRFRSEHGEKADDRLEEFVEVAKETPPLQTDVDVLAAAISLSYCWKTDFDWAVVDPSVMLLADFWWKALKETRGSALKHMPFDIQIQHDDTVRQTIRFFDTFNRDGLRPLVARELWSNRLFCTTWMQSVEYLSSNSNVVPLIPPGAWSDRSFCLALAQQRRKYNKSEPSIPLRILRPLIAPAFWSDLSFCTEWVKHTKEEANELKPLIPNEIWSDESFCVMRAKHMRGEVDTLFESFPAYKTDREFWFSLFSGGGTIYRTEIDTFREVSKQVPALCEDAELMLAALGWRIDNRTMFGGAVAPSLFEDPGFFQKALQISDCNVLEVVSHDLQRRFHEVILECWLSRHPRRLNKKMFSFLAPDLRENRSMCVHWVGIAEGPINDVPGHLINNKDFWLELASCSGCPHIIAHRIKCCCPFLTDEAFVVQAAGTCARILDASGFRDLICGNKQLAIIAMQLSDNGYQGLFWRLGDVVREDLDVKVCALLHPESASMYLEDEAKTKVEQLYNSCKSDIRDRLRTHECHVLALELEPTMTVPGLKEEFAGYLGVSSGKELSQLEAVWRKYH